MSEREPLVAGNWKMNGNADGLDLLLDGVLSELSVLALRRCSVLVFPSYVYLGQVAQKLQGSIIGVGSQDVDQRTQGAVTGGVSAAMVKDAGCGFVLVGHSERRTLFAESDELVTDKFEQCGSHGLVPIVCVGETLEERRRDRTIEVVTRQLRADLSSRTRILYGGSVTADNAVALFGMKNVDGALVGGASLKANSFAEICKAAEES